MVVLVMFIGSVCFHFSAFTLLVRWQER